MTHSTTRQILGHLVTFNSDNAALLMQVESLYPCVTASTIVTPIVISLVSVQQVNDLQPQAHYVIENQQLCGTNGASSVIADRHTMTAQLKLCDNICQSSYLLRHQFINTGCFYLLSYRYLTPLHCCAFAIEQQVFVCLGPSGVGKSTLAMAAHEQKFPVLAEDLLFIAADNSLTLYSDCREIHLFPDSAKRFTSIKHQAVCTSHNGKAKHIINILPSLRMAKCENFSIVFIQANYTEQLTIINKNNNIDKFSALMTPNEAGFDLSCLPRQQHLSFLAQNPSYIAQLGTDSAQFFQLLKGLN